MKALIGTYSPAANAIKLGARVVASSLSSREHIQKVTERSAYTRFGGSYLGRAENTKALVDRVSKELVPENRTFAVSSFTLHKEECGEFGALIKDKVRAKVSLEKPEYLFQLEKIDDGFVLGVTQNGYKEFAWKERRPRARRFFMPFAIYPKLARALVNLSAVREGEVFLDPFCGTGSLMIEASLMGAYSLGSDITKWIARGSLFNLKDSSNFLGVLRADSSSRYLPVKTVDAIATDVPYGRASSTKGRETAKIIGAFLSCVAEILPPRRNCVVMHPSSVECNSNSFRLEGQHLIYVHRNLTRAVSVLKKV